MNNSSLHTKSTLHYGWIIVLITFLVLLISAGIRSAPSVLIKPLEGAFGWQRADISLAVMISLFAFGFGGPLGGTLVERFGPRRIMLVGLLLNVIGLALLVNMRSLTELQWLWGIVVGVGTGILTNVLGSAVAFRWFNAYRGPVVGALGAAGAMGQLIFVPLLINVVKNSGWQTVFSLMALVAGAMILPVLVWMRNYPQDLGLVPIGETPNTLTQSSDQRHTSMRQALRTREFWLLAGSFFVCGYTTNGMIGTHLLPHAIEHGFVEAEMSSALALMGLMNIFGTLGSGWLSDRYDNRRLLSMYYGFRALSLVALPFILEMKGMLLFSIIYGLDWIATVPPTVNLTAKWFGRKSVGSIYGWIFCAHMIGAGIASFAGGFFRDKLGDYHLIFISAALMGFVAAGLVLAIRDDSAIPKPTEPEIVSSNA